MPVLLNRLMGLTFKIIHRATEEGVVINWVHSILVEFTIIIVFTSVGQTVYLYCGVQNLGNPVSIMVISLDPRTL